MAKGIPLEIGLRVDVLDDEGIWNTGVVVDVGDEVDDMVEIKYDGWGDEYNQWIPVSADRLAPLHMYTLVKKCWAKLNKWPWWPAFVVLRAPTTKSAAAGLEEEKKLYVEFFDTFDESKRSRCWMQKKAVESFQEGFEERASKRVGKKFPEFVDGTQRAKAGDSPLLFSGPGTLPIEYTSKMAVPLALQRQNFDSDNWFDSYRVFSDRYRVLYGYTSATDSAKRSSRSGSGENDEEVEIQEAEEVDGAARRPVQGGKVAAKFSGKGAGKGAAKGGVKSTKKAKTPAKRSSKGSSNNHEHGTEDEEDSGEEPEADENKGEGEEDDDDDGEEEDADSARGRRGSRLQRKRQREYVMPTRPTRSRRVKVIEELLESTMTSSASTPAPSSFQVVIDRAPLLAVAVQLPVRSYDDQKVDVGMPAVKQEVFVDQFDSSQASFSPEWLSPSQTPPGLGMPKLKVIGDVGVSGDDDQERALPLSAARWASPGPRRNGDGHQRKKRFAAPQRRSERGYSDTIDRQVEHSGDRLAPWFGGSCEQVGRQPWTIQRWFMHGLRAIANE